MAFSQNCKLNSARVLIAAILSNAVRLALHGSNCQTSLATHLPRTAASQKETQH
jgi:hypothetical protein